MTTTEASPEPRAAIAGSGVYSRPVYPDARGGLCIKLGRRAWLPVAKMPSARILDSIRRAWRSEPSHQFDPSLGGLLASASEYGPSPDTQGHAERRMPAEATAEHPVLRRFPPPLADAEEEARPPASPRVGTKGYGSPSLEEHGNVVESSPGAPTIKCVGNGCKRHLCPRCGRAIGYRARARILQAVERAQREAGCLGDVQMWTLTLDQANYQALGMGPAEAWDEVGQSRAIGELARAMGWKWYVVVLEWHDSGWPHWHLIIWEPVNRIYHSHERVTAVWKRGYTFYTSRHGKGPRRSSLPIQWAVNYITKYLCKPHNDPPAWAWTRAHIRTVWGSRAVGPLIRPLDGEAPGPDENGADPVEATDRPDARSNREAVDDCCGTVTVLRESVSAAGVVSREYLGRLALPIRVARRLIKRMGEGTARVGRTSAEFYEHSATWRRLKSVPVWVECRHECRPRAG